jgi:hypothetical protein
MVMENNIKRGDLAMTNHKVLLVNVPFARIVGLEQNYIPLSLWHLSTLLKQQGFEPYVRNLNIAKDLTYVDYTERSHKYEYLMDLYDSQKETFWEELSSTLEWHKPDMVGFTVLTPQIKIVNDLINYVKVVYGLPVFVGGPGATLNELKIHGANLIFQGGVDDLSILHELNEYQNETFFDTTFSMADYDGKLNFDGFIDDYSNEAYGHVFSSVGCYANCRFCGSPAIWKRKVYFKPITSFIRELKSIAHKFNPPTFQIWDENFVVNKKHLNVFFELYRLEQLWSCDARINSLNEETIKHMKQHGCYQIALGVESGCQRTLDYLNKGTKLDNIKAIFGLLEKYSIRSKCYLIMGFPEETYDDMLESLSFVKTLNPDQVTLSLFTPYEHTSLFEECRIKGLINDSYDESDHSHQSGKFLKQIHPEIDMSYIIKEIDELNKKDK